MCKTASDFKREFDANHHKQISLKLELNNKVKLLAKKYPVVVLDKIDGWEITAHDLINLEPPKIKHINSIFEKMHQIDNLIKYLDILEKYDEEQNNRRQLKLF